jgi:hypothetical protein
VLTAHTTLLFLDADPSSTMRFPLGGEMREITRLPAAPRGGALDGLTISARSGVSFTGALSSNRVVWYLLKRPERDLPAI